MFEDTKGFQLSEAHIESAFGTCVCVCVIIYTSDEDAKG